MADLTLRGMVIRTVDYRDNDRILTLFTAEQGRVDAKARNCRKATSPLLACTQPFTYGEYQLFCHKNKYIVDQGEVLESFYPLREDIGRFAAASLCAALCLEGVQAEESSADLVLLDHGAGGSGEAFDWSLAGKAGRPFFLAGGLDGLGIAGSNSVVDGLLSVMSVADKTADIQVETMNTARYPTTLDIGVIAVPH